MPQPEYYPMPFFATLQVRDVAASQRWYETLGFQNIFSMPGPGGIPMMSHVRWIKYADVLLIAAQAPVPEPKGAGIALNFQTPLADIDALFVRAQKSGARVLQEIGNRPWNARDFALADPDGYRLSFTAGPVEQNLTMDEITARAGKPAR
jgi:uncharacterized glyoxalase superfamily protein PhnB